MPTSQLADLPSAPSKLCLGGKDQPSIRHFSTHHPNWLPQVPRLWAPGRPQNSTNRPPTIHNCPLPQSRPEQRKGPSPTSQLADLPSAPSKLRLGGKDHPQSATSQPTTQVGDNSAENHVSMSVSGLAILRSFTPRETSSYKRSMCSKPVIQLSSGSRLNSQQVEFSQKKFAACLMSPVSLSQVPGDDD